MKRYRYLILVLSIALIVGLTVALWGPIMNFVQDPESLSVWIDSAGIWGPIVFMLLNVVQVILAVIPGGPFEIAAGALFGPICGAIMCDIAMSIGGILTFLLARKFGMKFIELFTTREKIESVKFLKSSKKSITLLFVLFLLPGTPKDLLCYVAGISNLKLSTWILINVVGRFPAILLSTMGGSALEGERYGIFAAIFVVLIVLYFVGSFLYKKFNRRDDTK